MEETRIILRPEKLMIYRYLRLLKVTDNIARALGFLAVSWSAVVLLGGFVHDLPPKEFRLLTALTFVLALRPHTIICMLRQQKWIKAHRTIISMLLTMQLMKLIFFVCFICLCLFSPIVSLGVSVSHLVHGRDIAANGAAALLNAALDIFYALLLLQSLFTLYYAAIIIYIAEDDTQILTNKHSGLEEEWGLQAIRMYYSETRKRSKDGKLPCNWDLITYAIGLLQISIQNLIAMIGRRGVAHDIIESRERAARIVAHLATSINITHFPSIVQCICSLLERSNFFPNEFRGAKELISQGLLILERLTRDEGNCTEISRHQRLVAKITSPLSSHDFLSNNARDKEKMVEMLNKSLTVVSRLLSSPGDGATRLRARSWQKLNFEKLLKALVRIFLEKEASNTAGDMAIVDVADSTIAEFERADREHKSTRLRRKAGEALARLLPLGAATDVNVADKLSKQEAIDLLTKVFDQILSSKMGKTEDAVKRKQSEEIKSMAAMLSLAVVMCNKNAMNETMVKKLKEILKVNKHSTAECLEVVKLTCHMVVAVIKAQPSCIQRFNEHNFEETLAETLETMSEVDDCLLFAGNDREVIKTARSLASLVKEEQELLKTAQEQGN
ncbi:hypothetical protein SETIT_2G087200v2 [Setaria italica]|uniref:Uncharacterized protein n=1 Tax=Setaria italica TaxID=4555 RepID=A0A368PWL9_SETIT|nr:hypothetical protein SETIT_2G087200v2 [Setaria italica]